MKTELQWLQKMHFMVNIDGFDIEMDANPPFGEAKHPTPKQLLLASMSGCTAMDAVSLLAKFKQNLTSLKVVTEAEAVTTYPQVFPEATFSFYAEGTLSPEKLNESIQLSLSKYCSVNAMVSKVINIKWKAFIAGKPVGEGKAEFNF